QTRALVLWNTRASSPTYQKHLTRDYEVRAEAVLIGFTRFQRNGQTDERIFASEHGIFVIPTVYTHCSGTSCGIHSEQLHV
ncbi:hypothetical protein AMELA_G00217160, partial [Ameiurus melas]